MKSGSCKDVNLWAVKVQVFKGPLTQLTGSAWVPTCSTSNADHVQMSLSLPHAEEKTKMLKQVRLVFGPHSSEMTGGRGFQNVVKLFKVDLFSLSWNTSNTSGGLNSSYLPSQNIWQHIVDEVLHTLMLSGTFQKQLEGFQIPAVIFNQALHCGRHGRFSVRETCKCFHQQHKREKQKWLNMIFNYRFYSRYWTHGQYLPAQQEKLYNCGNVGPETRPAHKSETKN